ncbi:MAG: hypothetical protein JXQ93_02230 [Flavobacteriaceae bacterium]
MKKIDKMNCRLILIVLLFITQSSLAQLNFTAGDVQKEYSVLIENGFALKSLREMGRNLDYRFSDATVHRSEGFIKVELIVNDKKQIFETILRTTGGEPQPGSLSEWEGTKKDNVKSQASFIAMGDIVEDGCKNALVKASSGIFFFTDRRFKLGDLGTGIVAFDETLLSGALGHLNKKFENGDQNDDRYKRCYSKYLQYDSNFDIRIKITLKNATLRNFIFPNVWAEGINPVTSLNEAYKLYREVKKLKVTILESPNDYKPANFYKDKILKAIKGANAYFTNKTGKVKGSQITAQVGNPRLIFKNVDLIIKKGSLQVYFEAAGKAQIGREANAANNDGETLQLIYVHTIQINHSTYGLRPIRGFSTADYGNIIPKNSDYTAFSYNRLFNDDVSVYGSHGGTIVHEFGHYFNLEHTFQGGCSTINDGVADTPATSSDPLWYLKRDSAGKLVIPFEGIDNPCSKAPRACGGKRRLIENIMDYGSCRWLFTQGQVAKMTNRMLLKPQLFNEMYVKDEEVIIDDVIINMYDLRGHDEELRKINTKDSKISIKFIYPKVKDEHGLVEIISDKEKKGVLFIYDMYGALLYKKDIRLNKGKNLIPILKTIKFDGKINVLKFYSEGKNRTIKILNEL